MLKNYFITAIRNLRRNKIYSLINILGLSIGLACAMLIILYVKDEVSYDRFHRGGDHIYRIFSQLGDLGNKKMTSPDGGNPAGQTKKMGITGYLQGPRFTAKIPEIRSFVRLRTSHADFKKGVEIKSEEILYVDSNFLSTFTFPLLSGNARTCLLQPNSIILSEDAARIRFGTTDALGKTVLIKEKDQFIPHAVTGVAKKCPQNSSIKFDYLLPLKVSATDENSDMSWFNFFLNTYVVLSPGADLHQVELKMQAVYKQDAQAGIKMIAEKFGVTDRAVYGLQPFTDMHLDKDLPASTEASNPVYSYLLSGIAFFILLIACINFVNLTVARSLKRAKEIGIRKVIGSSRKQLIWQFLGESFILCFAAFLLAIGLVKLFLPVFNELSNKVLELSYLLDAKLVAGYLALFFMTGLLAGFYPALVLSGYNPVQTLYSRMAFAGKNYLQKTLVVIQFTLASFLILTAMVIYSQFNLLTTEPLGYDDSNLVLVDKYAMNMDQVKLFREELMKDPNILGVAPKDGGYSFTAAKINGDSTTGFAYETVDEQYLPLLKIPVVRGRNFSTAYPSDSTHSVLVNEAFVAKAGWKDPIGQEVNFWYKNNERYRVIGVVKDYHFQSLNEKIGPELFTMKAGNDYGTAVIRIKPNSATASLQHIEKTFRKLFPISPYYYVFKDQENLKNYEAEAKWKQIIFFGAMLTIFISCIGLFGLSVLSAEKRTREIGIRKVLGASVNHVVTILSRDFLKLVILSLVVAMPLARIAANKWLENYPYRITLSWTMFAFAGLLVVLIAYGDGEFPGGEDGYCQPGEEPEIGIDQRGY